MSTGTPILLAGQLCKYWADENYREFSLLKFGCMDKETTKTLLQGALLLDRCTTGVQKIEYNSIDDPEIMSTGTASFKVHRLEATAPFVVYRDG